ncbi:MAG: hypothetical protein ABI868_20710 [Acidobacteriota bacterium]
MDLKALKDTPPWDWPSGTRKLLLGIVRDDRATESDRLLATEFAGDFTIISDDVAEALLSILHRSDLPDALRAQAAISLGPVLDHTDTEGFDEDAQTILISEPLFHTIQASLQALYSRADVPTDVRRRILEASVRAPQDWHAEAIREAYASRDESWRLTAVFCMSYVPGFDEQIVESLDSANRDARYEAVLAAGTWEVDAAWRHVESIITSERKDKAMLLAAIDAVASIRPHEAAEILLDLSQSGDDDIVEAVDEALAMAAGLSDVDYDEDEDEDDEEKEEVIH